MKRYRSGFRLLELMITTAIILLIVIVAMPALRRSKEVVQESAAEAAIRTISAAELTYSAGSGQFAGISELIRAGTLDERFAGSVSGYTFSVQLSGSDYTVVATPSSSHGGRPCYGTSDGLIAFDTDQQPSGSE